MPPEPNCTFLCNINGFHFFVRQMPPRPGGAEGRNIGRSPVGAGLARVPGPFLGGGRRAGRGRKRPRMTGSGRDSPVLRNEPNFRKRKLHQTVIGDRADRKRRGSPGSACGWRSAPESGGMEKVRCRQAPPHLPDDMDWGGGDPGDFPLARPDRVW